MTDQQFGQLLRQRFGAAKRANKGWWMIPCPTCAKHDATKMKRGVHPKSETTKCFICGIPLLFEHLTANTNFTRVEGKWEEPEEHAQARKYPFSKIIPINELDVNHLAVQFLYKDQLYDLDRYWEEHRIGYIAPQHAIDIEFPKPDRPPTKLTTAESIVFPVYYDSELVGWQLRYVPGTWTCQRMGKMKYLQVYQKGKYLYNYDNARRYDSVVVVEGIKKALKFPNAVATLGKGITDEQIQLVQRWKRIAFMYDGEDSTQEKTREIARQINAGPRECISIDPRDFGFASPDEGCEEQCQAAVEESWMKYA